MQQAPPDAAPAAPVVEVRDLVAHYGEREILHGDHRFDAHLRAERGEALMQLAVG